MEKKGKKKKKLRPVRVLMPFFSRPGVDYSNLMLATKRQLWAYHLFIYSCGLLILITFLMYKMGHFFIQLVCTEAHLCIYQGLFWSLDYSAEPWRQGLCSSGACILLGDNKQRWGNIESCGQSEMNKAARGGCRAIRKHLDRWLRGWRGPLGSEWGEEQTRGCDVGSDPEWGGVPGALKWRKGSTHGTSCEEDLKRDRAVPEGRRVRGWLVSVFEHHMQIMLF